MTQIISKLFLCTILSTLSVNIYAQKNESIASQMLKEDQVLIKEALAGSIFIIRQDYVLKSTNTANDKEYGKGSNAYFGRIYGFGVLCVKKMWTESKFKNPWTYDINYIGFEKSDTMKPQLSSLAIKAPADSVFIAKPYKIKKDSVLPKDSATQSLLLGSKSIFAYDIIYDTLPQTVRSEHFSNKDSIGWVVIAHTSGNLQKNDSLPVNISVFRTTLHFSDSTGEASIGKMPVTDNIIGGAFFKTIIKPGKIELVFSGILIKKVLNWYVVRPPKSNTNSR